MPSLAWALAGWIRLGLEALDASSRLKSFPPPMEDGSSVISHLNATAEALAGGGECGALLRQVDWAKTPVGPVETWPQSLRTVLSILAVLASLARA